MKITIDYFKQVCAAMASNAKIYKADSNDEQIKSCQDRLAALPPDVKKEESIFSFFNKKDKKQEKSERQKCSDLLEALFSGKRETISRINKLEQLKVEADLFVESQINCQPAQTAENPGKDMRTFELISSDQLPHASSIIYQFLQNLYVGNVGVAAGVQLKKEIDNQVSENDRAAKESVIPVASVHRP